MLRWLLRKSTLPARSEASHMHIGIHVWRMHARSRRSTTAKASGRRRSHVQIYRVHMHARGGHAHAANDAHMQGRDEHVCSTCVCMPGRREPRARSTCTRDYCIGLLRSNCNCKHRLAAPRPTPRLSKSQVPSPEGSGTQHDTGPWFEIFTQRSSRHLTRNPRSSVTLYFSSTSYMPESRTLVRGGRRDL